MTRPVRLVLLRHGQSEWNAAGIFTGWENAHLTAHGEAEAARAGSMLAEHGALPAFVHTSLQHRTIAIATGPDPTVIGLSAVLVAVRIGVTVQALMASAQGTRTRRAL